MHKSWRVFDGTYLDISFHPISIEIEALGAKQIDKILMLKWKKITELTSRYYLIM